MRAIAVLCVLVLLPCLVSVPPRAAAAAAAADRVGAGTASWAHRKLLQKVAARSALLDAGAAPAAAWETRRAGVDASLKKQTPSRSNPKQN
uniref:Uncharacterized protein n=1 Tax=Arundo donax TaxID=35708 RepID=A0A0A9AIT2_ARUDO